MIEIKGDLWDYYKKPGYRICLTVNGTIKANGASVMGRGCALEATQRCRGIASVWGKRVKEYGLKLMYLHEYDLYMFPVKYNWWEPASVDLIDRSSAELKHSINSSDDTEPTVVLPRPGCGNGRLSWDVVKPILLHLPDKVLVISKG